MDVVSWLSFGVFIFLAFFTFFYQAVVALIRNVTSREAVPVGSVPVPDQVHAQRMEQQLGLQRRHAQHARNQEIRRRIQEQLEQFAQPAVGQGHRAGADEFRMLQQQMLDMYSQQRGGGAAAAAVDPEELARRRVLEEQASEYEQALAADRQRRDLEEAMRRQAEEERAHVEAVRRHEEELRLAKERARQALQERRAAAYRGLADEPAPDDSDCVQLAMRFRNETLNRRFRAGDTIAHVRCFVEGARPAISENYHVRLAGPGRKTVAQTDARTLAELGLLPRALLIIDDPEEP